MVTIGKCVFSGQDVPKAKGIVKITPDGKPNLLLNRKSKQLFNSNVKSQKVLWTKGSRFFHKKGSAVQKEKKKVIQLPKIIRGFPMVPRKAVEDIVERSPQEKKADGTVFKKTEKISKNFNKR